MDKAVRIILKKLEEIEARIIRLEKKEKEEKISEGELVKDEEKQRDPLFNKAWEIIVNEPDDVSVVDLAKKLNISQERASKIMDQLAEAGFGVCYTKEV